MVEIKENLISVITVCYNAANNLEETMLSVLNQTYSNIEYIIIDGGSGDGTVDIIKKYADRLAYWVSESDSGIYDAMNKGISKANGNWLNFMNAGDMFINNGVLSKCFESNFYDNVDVLYGDVVYKYKFGKRTVEAGNIQQIINHMVFSHQSTFVRKQIMKDGFNLQWRLAADYNFLLGCFLEGRKFVHVSIPMSLVELDNGATHDNFSQSRKEVLDIHRQFGYPFFKRYRFYIADLFHFYVSNIVKLIMPKSLLGKIYNISNDDISKW